MTNELYLHPETNEGLAAAAEVFDQLAAGTFYEREAAARAWLASQGDGGLTRRAVERRGSPYDRPIE